jgi:hypothetical protein
MATKDCVSQSSVGQMVFDQQTWNQNFNQNPFLEYLRNDVTSVNEKRRQLHLAVRLHRLQDVPRLEGDRLEDGPADVAAAGVLGEAADEASGVRSGTKGKMNMNI